MDFSGASLRLEAEGEEKVLGTMDRIDKRAQQSAEMVSTVYGRSIAQASADFDRLYGKQSRAARQTQAVVEEVAQKVDASVGAMSHSSALGLGELARGLGRVAETGNLSTFAVREFTGAAFRLGGTLGGGVATGIGIAVIAIGALVEHFESAKKKADEMAEHYQQALDRIAHAGSLFQAAQEQQFAFSGDPLSRLVPKGQKESDVNFIKRTEGQLGLAREAMRINAQIDAIKNRPGLHYESDAKDIADLTDKLREYNAAVGDTGMRVAIAAVRGRQLNEVNQKALQIAQQKKNDKLDERSVAEYQNEELNRIVQRIKVSGDLTPRLINEHNEVLALRNEQQLLRYELDLGNLSVAQRIEKEKELARVTKELQQAEGTTIFMNGTNVRVNPKAPKKPLNEDDEEAIRAIKESGRKMKEEAERVANEVGSTLVRGVMDGMRAAFSKGGGLGAGFKAMTSAILDGLGEMFAKVAEKALIGSELMKKLVAAIQGVNPWVAAAAALALMAFGNSLRSSGGSGGSASGGGYGGGLPPIVNTGVVTASAPPSPVANPANIQTRTMTGGDTYFVIGEDPKAWRQVQERLDANARRG